MRSFEGPKLLLATLLAVTALLVGGCGSDQDGSKEILEALQPQPQPRPTLMPIGTQPFGMSYGDWGAQWWIWATSTSMAASAPGDPTGALCDTGQTPPVWFLAGTWGGDANRTCTIPAGQAVFFPVATACYWVPEDGPTEAAARAGAAAVMDGLVSASCTIDGIVVEDIMSYRQDSAGFTLPINAGTVLNEWGYPPGDRTPAVADGIYLMFNPLPPGTHNLEFHADFGAWQINVYYTLNVVG